MPTRSTLLGPSQALWNPGASPPSVFLAHDSASAAPISSSSSSLPLKRKKSKSLPGGFKLSELEQSTRAGSGSLPLPTPSTSAPSARSLLRSLLLNSTPPLSPPSSPESFFQRTRRISLPSTRSSPLALLPSTLVPPQTPPSPIGRAQTPLHPSPAASPLKPRPRASSASLVSLPPLPQTQPTSSVRSLKPTIKTRPRVLSVGSLTAGPFAVVRNTLHLQLGPPAAASDPSPTRPKPTLMTLPLPILTLILTFTIHSSASDRYPSFSPPIRGPCRHGLAPSSTPFALCLVSKLVRSIAMKQLYHTVRFGVEAWRATIGRPLSRVERFARTVGRNAGIGGLVKVLNVVVRGEDSLRVEINAPGGGVGGRKVGLRSRASVKIVAGEGHKSLSAILRSCTSLAVLSVSEPASSSSALDEEDKDDIDLSLRIGRPPRISLDHWSLLPPSSTPATSSLLALPLGTMPSLQSYTHHPSLPLVLPPIWSNITILSLPILIPRLPSPSEPQGWTPDPSYLPTILEAITPLLPKLERLVLRLRKPASSQGPAAKRSDASGGGRSRLKRTSLSTSKPISSAALRPIQRQTKHRTPHDHLLSFLTFVLLFMPDPNAPLPLPPVPRPTHSPRASFPPSFPSPPVSVPNAPSSHPLIHLELHGPALSATEEISLVAFSIRVRGVFGGRVAFGTASDEPETKRSRLSVVGRSVGFGAGGAEGGEGLAGIAEEEDEVEGGEEEAEMREDEKRKRERFAELEKQEEREWGAEVVRGWAKGVARGS